MRRRRARARPAPTGEAVPLGECVYAGPPERIGWAERQSIIREARAARALAGRKRTPAPAIDFRETREG